jgi:MinD superfamily P-loop ATPase
MIVGVTGGKGGTGKSFFAINLAVALAKKGAKVILLDCDPDSPSDHILLGAERKNKSEVNCLIPVFIKEKCVKCGVCVKTCQYNALFQMRGQVPQLMEPICNGCTACILACPHGAITKGSKIVGWTYESEKHGLKMFSGELKPSEPLSEKIVNEIKKRAEEEKADFVIVDTAAGAHCNVVAALEGCEKAYAITEPTPFGISDLEVIEEVLGKLKIPYEIVVNRSDITDKKIENTKFEIPYDRKIIDSYVKGIPLVLYDENHPVSKMFYELAEGLMHGD